MNDYDNGREDERADILAYMAQSLPWATSYAYRETYDGIKNGEHVGAFKPTPADILYEAWMRTEDGLADGPIMQATHRYAKKYPQWFKKLYDFSWPQNAMLSAAEYAKCDGDMVAASLLTAAAELAFAKPELF